MNNLFTINFAKDRSDRAILVSKELDKDIHPNGSFNVIIESTRYNKIAGSTAIEAFQFSSLANYISGHLSLKAKMQLELLNDRQKCVGEEMPVPARIWDYSSFGYLFLPSFEHCVVEDNVVDREPVYTVGFKIDWDDEHDYRTLKFRAGSFIQLTMEDI